MIHTDKLNGFQTEEETQVSQIMNRANEIAMNWTSKITEVAP